MHLSTKKEGREITDFGKAVKIKLIEIDQTQRWLLTEVNKKVGTNADAAYLNGILQGKRKSKRFVAAIGEILGIGQ